MDRDPGGRPGSPTVTAPRRARRGAGGAPAPRRGSRGLPIATAGGTVDIRPGPQPLQGVRHPAELADQLRKHGVQGGHSGGGTGVHDVPPAGSGAVATLVLVPLSSISAPLASPQHRRRGWSRRPVVGGGYQAARRGSAAAVGWVESTFSPRSPGPTRAEVAMAAELDQSLAAGILVPPHRHRERVELRALEPDAPLGRLPPLGGPMVPENEAATILTPGQRAPGKRDGRARGRVLSARALRAGRRARAALSRRREDRQRSLQALQGIKVTGTGLLAKTAGPVPPKQTKA